MTAKREVRIDRGELRLNAIKTPEGYLTATAKVARTGVFPYRNADGSVRFELRHPDDVFKKPAMDSMKQIPITLEHPRQMLTAANSKELSVGHVGDRVEADAPFVTADLIITDAAAIRAIEAGKQELSCGYFLDLVEDSGVYEGQAYTHRQTNIRENHLAITDMARLGPELRIDSDVPYSVRTEARNDSNTNPENKMIKVTINGIAYDCAPEVANELTRVNAALTSATETAKTEKVAIQAKLDTATGERDGWKTKHDALEKDGPAKILAASKARAALIASATKALDAEAAKNLDGMTDSEIKKAVVIAKAPKGTSLDGKSEEYIQARFELATENADAENADTALANGRSKSAPRNDGAPEKGGQDDARARMNARLKNGNKEPEKAK
jgi:hypothetical protein